MELEILSSSQPLRKLLAPRDVWVLNQTQDENQCLHPARSSSKPGAFGPCLYKKRTHAKISHSTFFFFRPGRGVGCNPGFSFCFSSFIFIAGSFFGSQNLQRGGADSGLFAFLPRMQKKYFLGKNVRRMASAQQLS